MSDNSFKNPWDFSLELMLRKQLRPKDFSENGGNRSLVSKFVGKLKSSKVY